MRYLLILILAACMCPMLGCGGGGQPPAGYSISNDWVTTPSGLKYRDTKISTMGPAATTGSSLTVNYEGWLDDGTIFDSTEKHGGQPFQFTLGQGNVIQGWDEGLMGLHTGSRTELIIPPALGYGDQGTGNIPPNSTLHFWVEIISVY